MKTQRALATAFTVTTLLGCGGGSFQSLYDNAQVQAAVNAANQHYASATSVATAGCEFADFSGAMATPPTLTGTWSSTSCTQVASSDGVGDGTTCNLVALTLQNESGGQITQMNQGAATSGAGIVGYIKNDPAANTGFPVVEMAFSNHASGEGCSQDLIDIMQWNPSLQSSPNAPPKMIPGQWNVCILAVVLDSTCAAPGWKESQATMTMQ